MTKPPVFVFSSGRSGSTLVQRIFNSYEDVMVWGEHGGFLKEVAAAYFRLLEHPSNAKFIFGRNADPHHGSWSAITNLKRADQWQAWLNWFSATDVDDLFRRFVRALFTHPSSPSDYVWGFKEIRYGPNDRVIEFLSRLFPDARFVFLVRNGLNTVSSQLNTFHPPGARFRRLREVGRLHLVIRRSRAWKRQNEYFLGWHQSGRLHSEWVHFEDLVAGKPVLDRVLEAIGKRFGPVQHDVLQSEQGRGASQGVGGDVNQRWRASTFLSMACAELIVGGFNERLGYSNPSSRRFRPFASRSSASTVEGGQLPAEGFGDQSVGERQRAGRARHE